MVLCVTINPMMFVDPFGLSPSYDELSTYQIALEIVDMKYAYYEAKTEKEKWIVIESATFLKSYIKSTGEYKNSSKRLDNFRTLVDKAIEYDLNGGDIDTSINNWKLVAEEAKKEYIPTNVVNITHYKNNILPKIKKQVLEGTKDGIIRLSYQIGHRSDQQVSEYYNSQDKEYKAYFDKGLLSELGNDCGQTTEDRKPGGRN